MTSAHHTASLRAASPDFAQSQRVAAARRREWKDSGPSFRPDRHGRECARPSSSPAKPEFVDQNRSQRDILQHRQVRKQIEALEDHSRSSNAFSAARAFSPRRTRSVSPAFHATHQVSNRDSPAIEDFEKVDAAQQSGLCRNRKGPMTTLSSPRGNSRVRSLKIDVRGERLRQAFDLNHRWTRAGADA